MGASILVAALSSAFGITLLAVTAYIGFLSTSAFGDSGDMSIILLVVSTVFIGIALYVGAIVTSNTFATIVAGRTRQIALMRLIGSTASAERRRVATQGLVVGAIGSAAGAILATAIAFGGSAVAGRLLGAPPYEDPVAAWMFVPVIVVILTTWLAAWTGSRRVLTVTPSEALGGSVARSREELARGRGKFAAAIIMGLLGILLLIGGVVIGLVSPLGLLVAFPGGLLSFTAIVMAAPLIMPPVLRLVGRMFGGSTTARMAATNALRYPERSSRMAIGVVVGVTLVVMFGVASQTFVNVTLTGTGEDAAAATGIQELLDILSRIMMALVGFSAVIAGVGLVNLLTIGVVQRRTELGLLRALGLTTGQIRRMVMLEALHITLASTLLGLVLGVAYGWAGAQSLGGSGYGYRGLIVAPAVPWEPVVVIVGAMALLTLIASVAPTRLATRISPVEALAAE
ncbi:ABC transporter permease [Microbacterium sorbitolivorans]|uniref:ABC transporter permease n=2 Tax=Microbacterium sorbitolivorans TaxID=1867410 RepID=A0A367Y320_9MICO|nr:ABC transporter permease [Microbacterium sorbitolivorans]